MLCHFVFNSESNICSILLCSHFCLPYFIDGIPTEITQQYGDNLRWLAEAEKHKLVVGSQAS